MPLRHTAMPDIVLIADDLTGALDSAVAFRLRGASAVVACAPEAAQRAWQSGAEVVAVSTNTRERSAAEADACLRGLLGRLSGFRGLLIKKIDSRLKGNIAAELAPLAGLRGGMFVCPAIPRLGRRVNRGAVTGVGLETPIEIAPRLGALTDAAQIPDITTDAELDACLAACDADTLFVGAAGLAEALARRIYRRAVQPPSRIGAPCLVAIGSRDPVTERQIADLQDMPLLAAPNGDVPGGPICAGTILRMTPGPTACPDADAAEHFARGVARAVAEARPASLLACGGETARAILRHLGVDLLQLEGECAPGVPTARALDRAGDLQIVTKSGGFGEANLLSRILPPKLQAVSRGAASP